MKLRAHFEDETCITTIAVFILRRTQRTDEVFVFHLIYIDSVKWKK